jgi:cephalosporin hydroxylase
MLRSSLLLCVFLLLNGLSSSATEKPVKHALIIAVGNYPKNTGWNPISSTNDVAIIKDALLTQGFEDRNIKVIVDAAATKQGIVHQLKLLTESVNAGDVVVVHFSGHGQQILDDNGDEPDGYDESIIPFDAQIRYTNKYHGENHLRDDELKELFKKLRLKLGKKGNILVILDSCHSGTGTRGYQKHRGTQIKFHPPDITLEDQGTESSFIDIGQTVNLSGYEISPIITISGSSPEQLNFEYTDKDTDITYGSLSYAFCKAFSKINSSL